MKKEINAINFINKIPNIIVTLLLIAIAPIGVWLFVLKTKNNKHKMYHKSKFLFGAGIFILFLIGIGVYLKIKEIIELRSSGMSLDMINFIPDNIYRYILGIVMIVSYFIGSKKIMNQVKIEKKYIKLINFDKETSIKKISKKISASMKEVKENIYALQSCGYLIPLEIDNDKDKINYIKNKEQKILTDTGSKKISLYKKAQCPKCSAMVFLKHDEYVECDFCGYGLIEGNNN